ncbi:TRAP-type C4-dicarboxylate transport system, substrate-binding protein [Marinobacter daqiaonensis]|uniref:TRAP-type C4-dicarboxylate transport system, substrate-binding protein n=1 Tax=Marinobacter daqiaonensis TaxID=650891 RepID=A0A1I6ING0_9GAMM|nr:C4-dicarboxylate TRAP transporter substrate-binding protein [Marinobacter daqiaonensis]SFR68149.1 TRAP-type C4-dicarboxylate transport system, substrate-binding protein [Marinobacter daqiaonensis]
MPASPRFRKALLPVALAAGLAVTMSAQAEELSYALGFPPNSAADDAAKTFAEKLEQETGGEVTVKLYAMSLLNLAEMSDGVRDGIADIGNVLTPYFPRQYPHANMAAELTMLLALDSRAKGRQGMAYAGAMGEFLLLNCGDCTEDFIEQSQIYLPMGATPEYQLLCTSPIKTAEDLKGKRLRVAGAQWSRWAAHFGASGVSLSGNEVYEALEQGVVDCTIQSNPELGNFGLKDVVTDITVGVPGGVFSGGSLSVGLAPWRDLSTEHREDLLKAASHLMADMTWRYQVYGDRDFEEARESGVNIHEPSEELVQASRSFVEQDIKEIARNYTEQYGMTNADDKIETLRPIVEKWVRLMDTADLSDSEDLANLYWEEILSKVDVESYGL